MRRASEVLGKALELLRGGWTSAPLSLDASGTLCAFDDEGVTLFCVHDALWLACGGDVEAQQLAEDVLNRMLRLSAPLANADQLVREWASEWLAVRDERGGVSMRDARTHGEVLQLFTRAHKQTLAKETR